VSYMYRRQLPRHGFAWLELLLALAALALVIQLVPSAPEAIGRMLDVRTWSGAMWFAVNAIFFAILCSMKYAPDIMAGVRERRARRGTAVADQLKAKTIEERKRQLAEKRNFYQGVRDSRRRRMW
jgi:hypothetical protein